MAPDVATSISAVMLKAGRSLYECIEVWFRHPAKLKNKSTLPSSRTCARRGKRFDDIAKITEVGLVECKPVIRLRDRLTDHAEDRFRRRFWRAMPTALAKGRWGGEAVANDRTDVRARRSAHGGQGGRKASARRAVTGRSRTMPPPPSSFFSGR